MQKICEEYKHRNPRKYESAPTSASTLVTYAVNNWLVLTGGGGGGG
jgi:hypothetical protein